MGGKSTSQGAVLSGKKASQSSDFDLHSWQGLTKVLKHGKESLADPAAYAEFRNLVLEYAQQGGDLEIKKQIDSIIQTFKSDVPQSTPLTQKEEVIKVKENSPNKEDRPKKRRRKRRKKQLDTTSLEPVSMNQLESAATQTPPQNGRRKRPEFITPPIPEPQVPKTSAEPPEGLPTEVPRDTGANKVVEITNAEPTKKPERVKPKVIQTELSQKQKPEFETSPEPTREQKKTTEVSLKSDDEYKGRIAEIKRMVNEQIGNPATLIDDYNELGKQYMMALLGALKATGPGGKESSVEAMQRLEDAFQALQEAPLMEEEKTQEPATQQKSEQIPEPKPQPVPEKQQTTVVPGAVSKKIVTPPKQPSPRSTEGNVVTQKVSEVSKAEVKAKPAPVPISETVDTPKPAQETPKTKQEKEPVPAPAVQIKTVSEPKSVPVAESAVAQEKSQKDSEQTQVQTPVAKPLPQIKPRRRVDEHEQSVPVPVKEKQKRKLSPLSTLSSILAKEDDLTEEKEIPNRELHEIPPEKMATLTPEVPSKKTEQQSEAPKPSETGYHPVEAVDPAKAIVRQSELSSPQITDGLRQLLDEWSIFRSSGIFGTGPSGMEHPLYAQLSDLSMGEVMAGRWEGSNREVTKSIKEYVHAWRHEQGVAYNIQETFEHFLKRVILRIHQRQE